MVKVNTLVTEDQAGASLLADAGKESGPSGPQPPTVLEPPRPSTTQTPPSREGARGPMPAPNTSTRVAAGWPEVLEELVNNSVIINGHRTLMSVVM